MINYEVPEVGGWYRRLDRPQPFQVVAYDDGGDTVDIEYFDGTLDEWPISHWQSLPIERCAPPEDWTGPFDNVEEDEPERFERPAPREAWQDNEEEDLVPDAEPSGVNDETKA